MSLIGYPELKDLLHLDQDSIDAYPALKRLRASVDAAIAEYLGRYLEYGLYSETLPAVSGTCMIPLRGIPVESITALSVDGLALTTTGYALAHYGVRLTAAPAWVPVVVSYRGGPREVPDAWRRAALLQTAYEYQGHTHIGAESVSTDGGTVNRPALGLLAEVRRMLDDWRHPMRVSA